MQETTDATQDVPTVDGAAASGSSATWSDSAGPRALSIGARVDRYTVLGRLGAGGMGAVYSAFDPRLDRSIALKVLQSVTSDDESRSRGRARLLREAKALARLSHPNVVPVYDAGEHDERVFVAMELVRGQTLDLWEKDLPGPATDAGWRARLEAILAAARGLAAAHDEGLVHRDIKPANIMVGDDGRVRVMDFGLARVEDAPQLRSGNAPDLDQSIAIDSPITRVGSVVGTPAYMSPEQIAGAPVGPAGDQFSLCVVAFELLYQRRPFPGKTLAGVAAAIVDGELVPIPTESRVPGGVLAALARGLHPEPDQRHPGVAALIGALETAARPATAPGRARLRTGAGVVALVGAGLVAFATVGSPPASTTPAPTADPCADAGAPIRTVWNESRGASVRAGLVQTGRAHARATAGLVETRLDAWANEWEEVALGACRETDGLPPTLRIAQAVCLERASGRVDALVKVLEQADERTADRAAQASAGVAPASECASAARLEGEAALPEDENARRSIVDARARLARLQALADTGHHADTLAPARELAAEAETLGWAPLQIESGWRLGAALERGGQPQDAERTLRDAYALSIQHRRDHDAIRIAGRLAYLLGNQPDRATEGEFWRDQGLALAARVGDEEARGGILNSAASVRLGQGDAAGAVRDWEEAFRIRARRLGDDSLMLAGVHYNLGVGHDALGDAETARHHWERALQLRKRLYGDGHPFIADSIETVAIATKRSGDVAGAMKLYRDALDRRVETLGADHPDIAISRTNIGIALTEAERLDEAEAELRLALQILEARHGPEHADLSHPMEAMADVQRARGDLDAAVATRSAAASLWEAATSVEHPRSKALRAAVEADRAAMR